MVNQSIIIAILFFLAAIAGCSTEDPLGENGNGDSKKAHSNSLVLKKANSMKTWFHARKTKPMWAKLADEGGVIETMETENSEPESYSKGDYICRGDAGDQWPQSAKNVHQKYDKTGVVDDQGWQKFTPRKDGEGVMAIQLHESFEVHASWGKLQGKPDDYLLKNFTDKDVEFPTDIWIVDKKIFESTYKKVQEKE